MRATDRRPATQNGPRDETRPVSVLVAGPGGQTPGPVFPFRAPSSEARGPARYRSARLTAEMTALSDAVTMFASIPTPHSTLPSIAHST